MTLFILPEEMERRADLLLKMARERIPDLTKEQEGELIGDLYLDATCEFFSDGDEMLEFVQEALQEMEVEHNRQT